MVVNASSSGSLPNRCCCIGFYLPKAAGRRAGQGAGEAYGFDILSFVGGSGPDADLRIAIDVKARAPTSGVVARLTLRPR